MNKTLEQNYPLGANLSMDAMAIDPYPHFARLQAEEPISWVSEINMYYIVRHADVQHILMDDEHFITGTPGSLVYDTFGEHMMTTEGDRHRRYRQPLREPFMPKFIRDNIASDITGMVDTLIDGFASQRRVELRSAFASRLPVQTMLKLFGLPPGDEQYLRQWYDAFERALANFSWDETIRAEAHRHVAAFHRHLQSAIERLRMQPDHSLLSELVNSPDETRLTDEEIKRNASIIFFGGISTVEALILNTLYALSIHPQTFARLRDNLDLLPKVLEEVVRWTAPVQSATRHVAKDCVYNGVSFKQGDTVNCMLGAANRDPRVFNEPDKFDIDRRDLRKHIGFATGQHTCLGARLARAEAQIAVSHLIRRLPGCHMDPDSPSALQGYEFRQPEKLRLIWD